MSRFFSKAWAGGLFVGEGTVGTVRRIGNGVAAAGYGHLWYVQFALQMCDERSVRAFGEVVGISTYGPYSPSQTSRQPYWRVTAAGGKAEEAVRTLWPWLKGTDKGDQAIRVFDVVAHHHHLQRDWMPT